MNQQRKEQLREVLRGALDDEIDAIVAETRAILTGLIEEKYRSAMRATVAQHEQAPGGTPVGTPEGTLVGSPPVPGISPVHPGAGLLPGAISPPGLSPEGVPGAAPASPHPDQGVPAEKAAGESFQEMIQSVCRSEPAVPGAAGAEERPGLYLYGIAQCPSPVTTGTSGVDGQPVCSVQVRDLSAVVHTCPASPYECTDQAVVREWVLAHQRVLDDVSARCGTVMPFSFDTIIRPDGDHDAQEMLVRWIDGEYDRLKDKLAQLSGKSEYGVQIFYHPSCIGERVAGKDPAVRQLKEEAKARGPGLEYLMKQKIEKELKIHLETELQSLVEVCYRKIQATCDDVRIDPIRKATEPDKKMLLNCSCLVSGDNYPRLAGVLEEIQQDPGLMVRFTGPWPVYSFV